MPTIAADLTGRKFGRWTVLARSPNHGKQTAWFCRCTCGREKSVPAGHLKNGDSQSCGCLALELAKAKLGTVRFPDEELGCRVVVQRIRGIARIRGIDWDLTAGQVREFIVQPCHYCGEEPSQEANIWRGRKGSYRSRVGLRYNGLDRIDSDGPYSVENCVPCCGICNRMKNDLTIQDFRAKIHLIATRMRLGLARTA